MASNDRSGRQKLPGFSRRQLAELAAGMQPVEHQQPAAGNRHDPHAMDGFVPGLRPLRQRLVDQQQLREVQHGILQQDVALDPPHGEVEIFGGRVRVRIRCDRILLQVRPAQAGDLPPRPAAKRRSHRDGLPGRIVKSSLFPLRTLSGSLHARSRRKPRPADFRRPGSRPGERSGRQDSWSGPACSPHARPGGCRPSGAVFRRRRPLPAARFRWCPPGCR